MAIDYAAEAKLIVKAFEEDGLHATVIIGLPGVYDVVSGMPSITYQSYDTYAFSKNYSVEEEQIVGPEKIELSFHAGRESSPLPDLMDYDDIKINFDNKTYKALVTKAVRPAGITMLYKVRAIEYQESW